MHLRVQRGLSIINDKDDPWGRSNIEERIIRRRKVMPERKMKEMSVKKNYSPIGYPWILSSQDPSVRSIFFFFFFFFSLHANFFPISRRDNGFLDPLDTLVTTAFVTAAAARPETVITRKSCLRLVWRKSVKKKTETQERKGDRDWKREIRSLRLLD